MINRAMILVLDELTAENAASGLTQKNTIIASGVAAGHFQPDHRGRCFRAIKKPDFIRCRPKI
jgi:hypothetical protein